MNSNNILKSSKGELINGNPNNARLNFSIDSREVNSHDWFIPIIGENHDSHIYLTDIANTISGTFIDERYSNKDNLIKELINLNPDLIIITVPDTILALGDIARFHRENSPNTKFIGITGSNGKTSVKELIANVLSVKYSVLKTEGNYNNHIGMPLTILRLKDEEVCVLEMGMNHMYEISYLTNIAKPNIAVITNIGTAHIGNLGSRENIFKTKIEILESNPDVLLINGEDKYLKTVKFHNIITYGTKDFCDVYTRILDNEFEVTSNNLTTIYPKTSFKADYEVINSLSAIKIGELMNMTPDEIKKGIEKPLPRDMRMEEISLPNDIIVINDAYNGSYESMVKGIEYVNKLDRKHKILVLGDMLEMGELSKEYHAKLANIINESDADLIFLLGDEVKVTYENVSNQKKVIYNNDRNKVIDSLKKELKPNTVVYFKASRSIKLEEIIKNL